MMIKDNIKFFNVLFVFMEKKYVYIRFFIVFIFIICYVLKNKKDKKGIVWLFKFIGVSMWIFIVEDRGFLKLGYFLRVKVV